MPHTTRSGRVRRALDAAVAEACDQSTLPVVLSVVSAADPVDRESGRLIHLPDAPFLVGDLDPVSVLRPHVSGPVIVDNDVNWAARAESAAAGPGELDDFAYVHLGEGLGCAVVSDGEVRRGHHGLTGEITHVLTTGPGGRSVPLTEVFELVGMRTAGTSAVDVSALLSRVDSGGASARRLLEVLGAAVSGVLAAVVAFADPRVIVIGGGWGTHPAGPVCGRGVLRPATPTGAGPGGEGDRRAGPRRCAPAGPPRSAGPDRRAGPRRGGVTIDARSLSIWGSGVRCPGKAHTRPSSPTGLPPVPTRGAQP